MVLPRPERGAPRSFPEEGCAAVPPADDLARRLADVAEQLLAQQRLGPTVRDIAAHAVGLVPGAHRAGVSVRAAGGRSHRVLAATDDAARECEALQLALGEGPCFGVSVEEPLQVSGDVAGDPRWRRWGPRAADHDVASVMTVRLEGRDGRVTSASVYGRAPSAFADPDVRELALLFARHAGAALRAAREISGLETALQSRHTIGVAQGVLMERYGLTVDAAFDLLLRSSSTSNIKLRDIAAEIVSTGSLPDGLLADGTHDAAPVVD